MRELITDRTEADVLLGTKKGFYNADDANRVEGAVSDIVDVIQRHDGKIQLTIKTNWALPGDYTAAEDPTPAQMLRYLNNVKQVCTIYEADAGLPKTMENFNWAAANQIEKCLQTALIRALGSDEALRYSGEMFAGEDVL